jgi:hypothetical protein
MWILNWIPSWAFHFLVVAGILIFVVGKFLSAILPMGTVYKLPVEIVGILLLCVGLWLSGADYDNTVWTKKAAEISAKVEVAKQETAIANQKLSEAVGKVTVQIKDRVVVRTKVIEKAAPAIDVKCELPQEAIDIHNEAAIGGTE